MLLDNVTLSGDAVSLYGQGQMNFERQINLTFHSLGGNDDYRPALLRKVMGGASQQIMQIHVEGTLDHPVTRSEAFPVVNKALHQWQEEMQKTRDRRSSPVPYPQIGSRPPANLPVHANQNAASCRAAHLSRA